jgi:hypothetical protein
MGWVVLALLLRWGFGGGLVAPFERLIFFWLLGRLRFAEMACLLCLTSLGSSWGREGGACG